MNFDCSLVTSGASCELTKPVPFPRSSCSSLQGTPNAGISKFKFTTGKKHRLRLINAGAEGIQRFTIDGHSMTVMANDFVPVKPYTTKVVTLGVGLIVAHPRSTLLIFTDWATYRCHRRGHTAQRFLCFHALSHQHNLQCLQAAHCPRCHLLRRSRHHQDPDLHGYPNR